MKASYSLPSLFAALSGLLLGTLLPLLTACGGDDGYHYPSVRQEFLTAASGADGTLQSVRTDEGEVLEVLECRSSLRTTPDSCIRIVSNYETLTVADGRRGAVIYAVGNVVAPLPATPDHFEELRQDPADVRSIWMGYDYLNMVVTFKGQSATHTFHFIETSVATDETTGVRTVCLSLYHDAASDVQAYTKQAYLSIPLRHYATEETAGVHVVFSLRTTDGGERSYEFDYFNNYLL